MLASLSRVFSHYVRQQCHLAIMEAINNLQSRALQPNGKGGRGVVHAEVVGQLKGADVATSF